MSAVAKRKRSNAGEDPPSKTRVTDASTSSPASPSANQHSPELSADDDQYESLYTKPVDFKKLAQQDPAFAPFVKGRQLNFSDPAAVQQLTKSLLKRDFGLKLVLPDNRLCPPVPNRHNYLLFLKLLLDTTSYSNSQDRRVTGLDIGTGSSCIYPLLGATQRGWSFYATDIDERNLEYAARNINNNDLSSKVTLFPRKLEDPLIPKLEKPITFCMTNPPFYSSQAELDASASEKKHSPSSVCTGAPVEMVTEGGEVAFVSRILAESLERKDDVQWYTAMLGFLSSVSTIIEKIKKNNITNWAVGELTQGTKTRRWVVAWSFGAMRPAERACRQLDNKQIPLPPPTEAVIVTVPEPGKTSNLANGLQDAISKLDLLSWNWDPTLRAGVGKAPGNVWNRNWRRKKKALEATGQEMTHSERDTFGFKVSFVAKPDGVAVYCRWLEGHDFVTFESFQGFLKTTIKGLE